MSGSPLARTAVFAVLLGAALLGWERWSAEELSRDELARLDASLEATARAVAEGLGGAPLADVPAVRLEEIATDAGRIAGVRVTLIDAGGRLLADSDVFDTRLPHIENHAGREEVRAAVAEGVGQASRRSGTVGRELRYVAVSLPGGGVVRVSEDLAELDARVARAQGHARGVAAAAALVAVALLPVFIWLFHLRPLRAVRAMADEVAEGRLDARAPRIRDPDLEPIARAIQEIATQLRARLREVTEEKEQLDAVLQGMVEGVLVVGARGDILLANSRLRELFGVHGELLGRPLLEGIRNADLEAVLADATRGHATVTRRITLAGAGRRELQVTAAPFPGQGERIGTVAVFHDISELMRLEEVRRDFVANASHELRTPLSAIRGFAETLLEGAALSPEDRKAYLEVIQRHAQRLTHIVEDLLELSTIEGRALRLELAPLDLRASVESLIADAQLRFEERDLEVTLRVEGSSLALADARAVDQVLGNLIDNAVKYTDPGGRIEVAVEQRADRVRVSVRDSGIGIPPRDAARIFERFYRVDKARSRALGGTGLGLSIVKHLVQAMDGVIGVESELGQGSTFTFTLPAP